MNVTQSDGIPSRQRPESVRVLGSLNSRSRNLAWEDLRASLTAWQLWGALGWSDISRRYRRATFGPFWITLTQAFTIGSIGFLYSFLFKIPVGDYFPFLTMGILTWGLISNIISESCTAFTLNEAFIKQLPLPKSLFLFQVVWRNLIIFLHNLIIYVPVALIFSVPVGPVGLWALFGVALICVNGLWFGLVLAMVCARFRDVPQLVTTLLQLLFFMTPVIWNKQGMGTAVQVIAGLNPLSYFLETVRCPLLGMPPDLGVTALALLITVANGAAAMAAFTRYRARIAFWV